MKCPKCGSETKQHKAGKTESGSQRYRCYMCKNKYTPEKKPHSYGDDVRKKAVEMYVDGISLRKIARHLGMHHQSVSNWAQAHAEKLPESPKPEKVEHAEMDELFTFIGRKKTKST
jgi:transposase-like protein